MKRVLLVATFIFLGCIHPKITYKEFFAPKENLCLLYGGYSENNKCYASWESANKICQASNALLPSLETFKTIVLNCKGEISNSIYWSNKLLQIQRVNRQNSWYQKCYQKNDFSSLEGYWSSKENSLNSALYVRFKEGIIAISPKAAQYLVICKPKI